MTDKKSGVGYFWSGASFDAYAIIEEDFLKILNVIPLESGTLNYYSPRFGDILLRVGSNVDIFFREWLRTPELNKDPRVKRIKKKEYNIKIYQDIFYDNYLKDERVTVRQLSKDVIPFSRWTDKSPPEWWTAHNEIKHDGYSNRQSATLKNALRGLAGLFVLHCANRYSFSYLKDIIRQPYAVTERKPGGIYYELCTPPDTGRYLFKKLTKPWQSIGGEID